MKLYHIDRLGRLKDGQRIELIPLSELSGPVGKSRFARQLFPEGVSHHGAQYLDTESVYKRFLGRTYNNFELLEVFNIEALVNDVKLSCSKSIELVFELVRQRYFPGKPSRMTSLCAVDNPEARGWKSLKADEKQLFKIIAPDDTPSFDGAFLHGGLALNRDSFENWKIDFSISELFDLAYAYWSGESTTSPQYEYLVQLPIAQIHLVHAS